MAQFISKYFTEEDLVTTQHRDVDNTIPNQQIRDNIMRHSILMDQVWDLINGQGIVTSWYRSPALNTHIGGSTNSKHCFGVATDAVERMPDKTSVDFADIIINSAIAYDAIIGEVTSHSGPWIHIQSPITGTDKPRRLNKMIINGGAQVAWDAEMFIRFMKARNPKGEIA